MRVLIAIPVFNERKYAERVLGNIRSFHSDILVVDDGSTDGTGEVLAALAAKGEFQLITHSSNRGYGQSLIDAFAFADRHGFDWVITMDCDEQHEPERIPQFMRAIKKDAWDIVSGSRYLKPEKGEDLPPPDRRSINTRLTALLNDRLGLHITDAFCGYKAHRVTAMRKLALDVVGYAFPMQFWPQSVRAGLRITEIPVRLIYNDPNRHFGGALDDADNRLRHYLDVFEQEMAVAHSAPDSDPATSRPESDDLSGDLACAQACHS